MSDRDLRIEVISKRPDEALDVIEALEKRVAKLENILAGEISTQMKMDHWGEHSFREEVEAYDYVDRDCYRDVVVPWTTCKEIYKGMLKSALRSRADKSGGN